MKGVGMDGQTIAPRDISRRDMMKTGLKAGAYAAPIILASVPVAAVAAATPAPILCGTTTTFTQDVAILNGAPSTAYDVYAAPNGSGATKVLSLTTDATFAAAFGTFSLTVPSGSVTSVTISVVLAGQPATPALATFSSALVTTVACTAGGPRAAAVLVGRAFQEANSTTSYKVILDAAVQNGVPNTAYTINYQANNGTGGLTSAGTVTTNAAGNGTAILTVTVGTSSPTPPTSYSVNAVPAGGAGPTLTATLSGSSVVNVAPFPGITVTNRPALQILAIT